MNSKEYLEKMTNIQQNLLEYFDNEGNYEDKLKKFKDQLSQFKIQDNQHELKSLLYLITNIANNYHRGENFFNKIETILNFLKDDMKKYFSNSELFHVFRSNKRILLFLIEEKIMNFDEYIVKHITKDDYLLFKYPQYFQPEIQPFMKEKWFPKYIENEEERLFSLNDNSWVLELQKELPEDFREQRKIGENDTFICKLIRKDLIQDFITYVNKVDYKLDSMINLSIYETNNFLVEYEDMSLIEYAAFFGSIQIFNYLRSKNIELTSSLWYFAIHGKNVEIIHILEEEDVDPPDFDEEIVFKESIKCHHINIANYIKENLLDDDDEDQSNYQMKYGLQYYNFAFIQNDKINEDSFNYLCKYDYFLLANLILSTIDNVKEMIFKSHYFYSIQTHLF